MPFTVFKEQRHEKQGSNNAGGRISDESAQGTSKQEYPKANVFCMLGGCRKVSQEECIGSERAVEQRKPTRNPFTRDLRQKTNNTRRKKGRGSYIKSKSHERKGSKKR